MVMKSAWMTFSGMSVIYYGDEISMDGENDPDCRKTMAWDNMNTELLDFYKQLISIRKKSSSLRHGDFKCIYSTGNVFAFARQYNLETTYVIINNSETVNNVTIPIFEDITKITKIQSFASNNHIKPEPCDEEDKMHNQDIFDYKSKIDIELEPYSFDITRLKMSPTCFS